MSSTEIADRQPEAPSLAGLQSQMMAAVLGEPLESALRDQVVLRPGLDTEDQFAIYQHATAALLEQALTISYPATARAMGGDTFAQIIGDHVKATPSRSGDLEAYGADFGDFLERLPLADIPLIAPDLARFEWLVAQLARAPEKPALDHEKLAAIPPEQLPALRLALVPRAALFRSSHPVLATWSEADSAQYDRGDSLLLVCDDKLRTVELNPDAWAFHSTLSAGSTLREAVEAAISINPDFDLGAALDQILRMGASSIRS
ncbi:MAG: DNA-binding domain-containing protein [Nevskia sp.]|nr:DNA-binding domain-containing protein [Nevskia sp.]